MSLWVNECGQLGFAQEKKTLLVKHTRVYIVILSLLFFTQNLQYCKYIMSRDVLFIRFLSVPS